VGDSCERVAALAAREGHAVPHPCRVWLVRAVMLSHGGHAVTTCAPKGAL
jgi:hypothetical protein